MVLQRPTFIVTVDDKFLLVALDRLYRKAMQAYERTTLLVAARSVTEALDTSPLAVPVEGYYGTDSALMEYFRLMRALRDVADSHVHGNRLPFCGGC